MKQFYKNKTDEIVKTKIKEIGRNITEHDLVAIERTNDEPTWAVCINFMGTGLHIPATDIDADEAADAGIKVWKTWSYKS